MRQFLVTKFVCHECRSLLEVDYVPPGKGIIDYADGEPTGASRVELVVAVMPCSKCSEPSNRVMKAVKDLVEAASK